MLLRYQTTVCGRSSSPSIFRWIKTLLQSSPVFYKHANAKFMWNFWSGSLEQSIDTSTQSNFRPYKVVHNRYVEATSAYFFFTMASFFSLFRGGSIRESSRFLRFRFGIPGFGIPIPMLMHVWCIQQVVSSGALMKCEESKTITTIWLHVSIIFNDNIQYRNNTNTQLITIWTIRSAIRSRTYPESSMKFPPLKILVRYLKKTRFNASHQ